MMTDAATGARIGQIADLSDSQKYADVAAREQALICGHADMPVEGGALPVNYCVGVKVPRTRKPDMHCLTAEQVEDLAHAISHPTSKRAGHGSSPLAHLPARVRPARALRCLHRPPCR